MAERKQRSSQKEDSAPKSKSRAKPKASAKYLTALENKLSAQINSKFSSLDGRIAQLIGLVDQ